MNNEKKTTQLFVSGMHCDACELYVERKLAKLDGVTKVAASLSDQSATLEVEADKDLTGLVDEANELLIETAYRVSVGELKKATTKTSDLVYGFLIAAIIVVAFVLLQQAGVVKLVSAETITYPVVFLIGVVASLSSCMAVVGGLVLSISSTYAKESRNTAVRAMITFHLSRIVSFFVLGVVIGALGATITLTPGMLFIMNIILFVVMVILGLNLLEVFPVLKRFQLTMPKLGGKVLLNVEEHGKNDSIKPIMLGVLTFFLPCGFTQSMQLYSLTTGNAITGGLTMLVFVLGTLPALAFISVASVKLSQGLTSDLFFKTAGFLVLFFALFSFLSALVAAGIIRPIFNF